MSVLRAFALRLLVELSMVANLPEGPGFKPTTYIYGRRGEGEGVYARGLRLASRVKVERLEYTGDYGELIARIPSESGGGEYTVKVTLPLDYDCTCPWGTHRFNPCKHVYATVTRVLMEAGVDIGDPMVNYVAYMGLNKLAYHKARTSNILT